MSELEESVSRFKQIFEDSKLSPVAEINNVLIVIDETQQREEFEFNLVDIIHEKTKASFTFLYAVRSYIQQAKDEKIELETLPNLIKKIKDRYSEDTEVFSVAFIPDEDIKPYERIIEIIKKRNIDFLIIPAPFTLFADEEEQTEGSLGITIDTVIMKILLEQKIPIFLVRQSQVLPFSKTKILIRETMFRKDFLGWARILLTDDALIEIFHSELSTSDLERINLYLNVIKNKFEKENRKLTIRVIDGSYLLQEFCTLSREEREALLVFQAVKTSEDDSKRITRALCYLNANTLIFPPID